MVKRTSLFMAFVACAYLGLGQQTGRVLGLVSEEGGHPVLRNASVILMNRADSIPMASAITDSLGRFVLNGIAGGTYVLHISAIGFDRYRTTLDLDFTNNPDFNDTISLPKAVKSLSEIIVKGKKPFLEQRPNMIVVNVSDNSTVAGATAFETLRLLPGVLVVDENILVGGKSGVVIMINGKTSPYTDLQSLLKDIPGSNIDRIELITHPDARYEATGGAGIINIVLKKDTRLGLNGTFTGGTGGSLYNQEDVRSNDHFYYRYSGSLGLNYRTKKWDVYGNMDYIRRNVFEVNNYNRYIDSELYKQTNYYPYFYNTYNYRAGVDFTPDKKTTIGVLIDGNNRSGYGTSRTYTDIIGPHSETPIDSFVTNNLTDIRRFSGTGNVNVVHTFDSAGTTLSADFDYTLYRYNNTETIDISTPAQDFENIQTGKNPLHYINAKVDYVQPLGANGKLETGVKISDVVIHSSQAFTRGGVIDPSMTNSFDYQEGIRAFYLNGSYKVRNFEGQAGVRFEQSNTVGTLLDSPSIKRQYFQAFPSVSLDWKFYQSWGLNAAYSRRIDRPDFLQLNPFAYFIDSLTYARGNPYLQPQLTDAVKIGFSRRNLPLFSISYSRTTNEIYPDAPKQVGIIMYTEAENLGTHKNLTGELDLPVKWGQVLTGNWGIQAIYNKYKANYLDTQYNAGQWNWQTYLQANIKISDQWAGDVNAFYSSGILNQFMRTGANSGVSLGIQKKILSGNGKISLSVNDIFYQNSTTSTVNYGPIHYTYYYRDDSRNARLTFTYSFGNKKVKEARNREIGTEEEKSRL